jgi:hypothetical protein
MDNFDNNAASPPPELAGSPDRVAQHPESRYETRDVRFRWIAWFVVISLVAGAAQLAFVWVYTQYSEREVTRSGASRYPLSTRQVPGLPPEPRLEQIDRTAGVAPRASHERLELSDLDSFGSTKEPGFVRIPINDAIGLVVDKLPVRKQGDAADAYKSRGLVGSGESNSGRMFRGPTP